LPPEFSVHTHSLRLASGEEALITRVLAPDGRAGFGFSLRLDATQSRHMAEWNAGVRPDVPDSLKGPLPPEIQAAIPTLRWLP
jgi:hypothetical protein